MIEFVNIHEQVETATRHIEKVTHLINKTDTFFEDIKKRLEELGFEHINSRVSSNNTGIRKTFKINFSVSAYKDDHKISLYNMEILTSCSKKEPYKKTCILNFGRSDYDHINIEVDGKSQCYDNDIGMKVEQEYKKAGKFKLINIDNDDYKAALEFVLIPFKAFAEQNFDNDSAVGQEIWKFGTAGRTQSGALYDFLSHTLTSISNEIKKREIAAAGKKFS